MVYTVESVVGEKGYDYRYVLDLCEKIKKPRADVRALFLEVLMHQDGPERPLPFELVQAVLNELHGAEDDQLRQLLSVATNLQIWKEYEWAWLLLQKFRLQQESGNWREQLIPLISRIWVTATRGSALRGWAAYWLAEQSPGNRSILLAAFIETAPGSTYPGHYVQRLKLWRQRQKEVEAVLPEAIPHLADAWGLLGKESLADRAAVAALLALGLQSSSPSAVGCLRQEVEALLVTLPDNDGLDELRYAINILRSPSLPDAALAPLGQYGDPLAHLLREGCAYKALQCAERTEPPSDADGRLRWTILTAEACRRARSSSAGIEALEKAVMLLSQAKPETAWAFHYLKAGLHWSRIEYHAALLEVEGARRLAGEAGSHDLLYRTHILRQRIAHNLRLDKIKAESDTVLDALDQLEALRKMPPGKREELSIAEALGVEVRGSYGDALRHVRTLRKFWENASSRYHGYLRNDDRANFSNALTDVAEECTQALPSAADESFFFAQLRFDQAQLALAARLEWSQNSELYQATLKPWLDDACRLAEELEAYKLFGVIKKTVDHHRTGALRQYEIPGSLVHPTAARRYDLEQVSRLLRAAATATERQWILGAAHRGYAEYLGSLDVDLLSSEEVLTLLDILQDLKQPSLEDGSELRQPGTQAMEQDFPSYDEEIISDDLNSIPQERWHDGVARRMIEEDALCLDLFLTKNRIYCFVTENAQGQLNCRLLSRDVPGKNDLRQRVNVWRGFARAIMEQLGSNPDESDLHLAAIGLERRLQQHGNFLMDFLEEMLANRHAGVIYMAPMLGLHGLPLHAVLARNGWCLSRVGTVLQISKTRQLAEQYQAKPRSIQVLSAPEFQKVAEMLANRVDVTIVDPRTRQELSKVIHHEGQITVILGHGLFDKERPWRTRIVFGHGLRLTLKDIQELELEGTEIVLLSCWAGWGVRSNLPIGEVYSGPSSWMVGGAGAILSPLWPVPIVYGTQFIGDYLYARGCGLSRVRALQYAREQSTNYLFGGICSSAYVLWGTESP